MCVLSGHAQGVVLKWTLVSGLVGFEMVVVVEETFAPQHTRMSTSVRAPPSLRGTRPGQTDLLPRSENHGSKFVTAPAFVSTNPTSVIHKEVQRPSLRVLQRCAPSTAPKTPKTQPFPPLRRWKRDGSHHTWRIMKSCCFPQPSRIFGFFLWCPILFRAGCVTRQPFPACHSCQLPHEVFCTYCGLLRIVALEPALYYFLGGTQQYSHVHYCANL